MDNPNKNTKWLRTVDEIKAAVDAGLTVYADSMYYQVKASRNRQTGELIEYLIVGENDYAIGLTWRDGVTPNYKICFTLTN